MRLATGVPNLGQARTRPCTQALMRDELTHALVEALFELEVLPDCEEGALMGIYAVIDDVRAALRRTESLDRVLKPSRN